MKTKNQPCLEVWESIHEQVAYLPNHNKPFHPPDFMAVLCDHAFLKNPALRKLLGLLSKREAIQSWQCSQSKQSQDQQEQEAKWRPSKYEPLFSHRSELATSIQKLIVKEVKVVFVQTKDGYEHEPRVLEKFVPFNIRNNLRKIKKLLSENRFCFVDGGAEYRVVKVQELSLTESNIWGI